MRQFLESHFGLVLIASCLLGLFMPYADMLPAQSAIALLAAQTFLACYRLEAGAFGTMRWRRIGLFCVGRYMLVPIGLWCVMQASSSSYAPAVALMALIPAGASSPALIGLFGGNVAVGFAVTVACTTLAPFYIPLFFAWAGGQHVAIDGAALFGTLCLCILLPLALYRVLRNQPRIRAWSGRHGRAVSIVLVAMIVIVVIARQRELILRDPLSLAAPFALSFGCYALFLLAGWFAFPKAPRGDRIAYATCSAFNNAALGVSLALLHFPPQAALFMVLGEIVWALLPGMFRWWLRINRP